MKATFAVAEHSLQFFTEPTYEQTVNTFIELLEAASEQGNVVAWEEIYEVPTGPCASLHEFIFDMNSPLDRDLRVLLSQIFQRIGTYSIPDADEPPYELDAGSVTLDFAPSLGMCVVQSDKSPWGLICVPGGTNQGKVSVTERAHPYRSADVHFIDHMSHFKEFWRDSLDKSSTVPEDFATCAGYAFPQSIFATGIWNQVGRFEGTWMHVRELLLKALSGLDDGAPKTFASETQSDLRIAKMSALYGVDCSPDSPQTHKNKSAQSERDVEFTDRVRHCEWHAKLEPHRNRIHFCVDADRVYVGLFVRHLP